MLCIIPLDFSLFQQNSILFSFFVFWRRQNRGICIQDSKAFVLHTHKSIRDTFYR